MTDPDSPMQRVQAVVRNEPALQAELRRAPDRDAFVALVIERSRERGIAIGAAEVAAELEAAKRVWTTQWLIR